MGDENKNKALEPVNLLPQEAQPNPGGEPKKEDAAPEGAPDTGGEPTPTQPPNASGDKFIAEGKEWQSETEYLKNKLGRQGNELGALRQQNLLLQETLRTQKPTATQTQTPQAQPEMFDESQFGPEGYDPTNVKHQLLLFTHAIKGLPFPKSIDPQEIKRIVAKELDDRRVMSPDANQLIIDIDFVKENYNATDEQIQTAINYADQTGIDNLADSFEKLYVDHPAPRQNKKPGKSPEADAGKKPEAEPGKKAKPGGHPKDGGGAPQQGHNLAWARQIAAADLPTLVSQLGGQQQAMAAIKEAKEIILRGA